MCLPDPYGCSCAAGFTGILCDKTCRSGTYGAGCSEKRNCHCANGTNCDVFTGLCNEGCDNNWHGKHCDERLMDVKDVSFKLISSFAANLSWEKPSELNMTVRYYIISYQQIGWRYHCNFSFDDNLFVKNTTETCLVIDNLNPFAIYTMNVKADVVILSENSTFNYGIKSEVVINTSATAPTPSILFHAAFKTTSSLYFEWVSPLPFGGLLDHHKLSYKDAENNSTDFKSIAINTSKNQCSIKGSVHCWVLKDLIPNHTYDIQLRAFNKDMNKGSQAIIYVARTSNSGCIYAIQLNFKFLYLSSTIYNSRVTMREARRRRAERALMSTNQTTTANATERHRATERRTQESSEHRDERLRLQRERSRAAREQHVARYRAQYQERQQTSRSLTRTSFFRLTFEYSSDINYSAHSKIAIGPMDQICRYCQALKFCYEPPGMCCSLGKVVLLPLLSPPEPLQSLLAGESRDSKLFLRMTRKFNSCFQRTADKTPSGEHAGRFNAPIVEEVVIIMAGDPVDNRAIKITRRDSTVHVISDLHRSYDALQYPLIFWQGQDGYHINIKQVHPVTGNETNKKVSSMCYYAYRLMIRNNQDNYILRYRQLYHQYVVDIYAKIASERLRFLRFNQVKLQSEDYIHLRNAIIKTTMKI
ncbi:helitron_like_N domain-containing protein [Caerostris extrusa]|uniref:Helitron_like_N domain-containing protein n=1 Tax=Caerostris extrusa TaxID=172846 RepID=A0AAV4U6N0_CAEEX|nr:helitron_like_N domain-containing protein [Caerostris extrusa]